MQKMHSKMPDFKNEDNLHVYKFLELALVDYANCRKYGENYKEEEMDKEMVLEVRDPYDDEYNLRRKGNFPTRKKVRVKSKKKNKDRGLLRTDLTKKQRRSRSPNVPRRTQASVDHRVLMKQDFVSGDGMKIHKKKNLVAPNRAGVTP